MELLLIRHGKTQGNLEGRYVGRTDEPLLETSLGELKKSDYRTFAPDFVYSSRLLRCRQTADCIFPDKKICIWPGLEETDFGAFEYKNYEELNGDPAYQAWLDSGGMLAFPGGEAGADFRNRCREAFVSCMQDAEKKQAQRIAIVAHGGTIMSIMEAFAVPEKGFYDWQVKNGQGFQGEVVKKEGGTEHGIWKIYIREG